MRTYRGHKPSAVSALILVLIISVGLLYGGRAYDEPHTPPVTPLPTEEAPELGPVVYDHLRALAPGMIEPAITTTVIEESPEPVLTYLGEYQIYGYTPTCRHCCGKTDGITASGVVATVGQTVAMKGYPFGTKVFIEGLGYFIVEDRGVSDGVVDVACVDHKACYAITGNYPVYLVEEGGE